MYNKTIVIGNLTRDIELKYLSNNTALAKGAIATSHKYKMQNGEQKEEVCFLDFTIFGRVAEVANQYLHKGSKVMLEGRLQFDQWTDNTTGVKRSKHSLMVSEMKMLGGDRQDTGNTNPSQVQKKIQRPNNQHDRNRTQQQIHGSIESNIPVIDIDNDEIPF